MRKLILLSLLSLTSCCDHEKAYKVKFKYKIGEFVQHRVSGDKILIIDTIRYYDCIADDNKVELNYRGINSVLYKFPYLIYEFYFISIFVITTTC